MKKRICHTLMVLCLCGYGTSAQHLQLCIEPVFGGQALQLNKQVYQSPAGDSLSIGTFRFYVSAIRLWHNGKLVYAEKDGYHLVDAADSTSQKIELTVPILKYDALSFAIGIDSLANVSGAMSGDLDPLKAMYWAWHSGYINAKLEGKSMACPTKEHVFEFHIGGYAAPYASLREVKLTLPEQATTPGEASHILLQADAACWFHNLDLTAENSILLPSAAAQRMADRYALMFKPLASP